MYQKTITFKFNSADAFNAFRNSLFDGLDEVILDHIEGNEGVGSITPLAEYGTPENEVILVEYYRRKLAN